MENETRDFEKEEDELRVRYQDLQEKYEALKSQYDTLLGESLDAGKELDRVHADWSRDYEKLDKLRTAQQERDKTLNAMIITVRTQMNRIDALLDDDDAEISGETGAALSDIACELRSVLP